jgi:AbrB family looped-hinge helix DNA binding protein
MDVVTTTKLSSKGQVVIPEELRNQLGLKAGTHFVVVGRDDTVILKAVSQPNLGNIAGLLAEAKRKAQKAGLKPSDIRKAINDVRKSA